MTVSDTPTPFSALTGEARFRERRIEVRREAGHRRLLRLIALGVVAFVIIAGLGLAQSPFLDVDEIGVRGVGQTSTDEILAAAGISTGDTMLTVDLGLAATAVEALPWVHTATVTRSFPGSIEITVTERVPVAVVMVATGSYVVDASGRVLSAATAEMREGLAVIEFGGALPGEGEQVSDALSMGLDVAALSGDGLRKAIAVVNVEPELEVVLGAGGVARFGDGSKLQDKVEALATVVARVDLDCLEAIDLRVPTHPVLTRAASC